MKFRYFVADFETTSYEGQEFTEVWATAISEIGYEHPVLHNSIEKFLRYVFSLGGNKIIYFHNLKFDGTFIISYLLEHGWQQGFKRGVDENGNDYCYRLDYKEMPYLSFNYVVSNMGQWYTITLKMRNGDKIEFRDSVKLLPFSVKDIGENFCKRYKKLEIEYTGKRKANGVLTVAEQDYICNDVLVMDEAMQFLQSDKKLGLTVGSLALKEYKHRTFEKDFRKYMPNMTEFKIDEKLYGFDNADSYIRQSYKGGWCYVKKGYEGQLLENGFTIDVNSLYPFVMLEYEYPVGNPTFVWGNDCLQEIPKKAYYFVTFECSFYLKRGHLPTVQVKNNPCYRGNVWLETSNIYHEKTGTYRNAIIGKDGNAKPITVRMTMTCKDFELFLRHYNVKNLNILHGCYFRTMKNLFKEYIYHYKEIKETTTGAVRVLAKLFLNSLYGKLASSTKSDFKTYELNEDGILKATMHSEDNRESQYIPIGSAITSYARCYTINTAQANYDMFAYADTDSLHCAGNYKNLKNVALHKTDFGKWDLESEWKKAVFLRQKTYIEEMQENYIAKNGKYIIKAAGMGTNAKSNLYRALTEGTNVARDDDGNILKIMDNDTQNSHKMDISEFKQGLIVEGNLKAKLIRGGTILCLNDFAIK